MEAGKRGRLTASLINSKTRNKAAAQSAFQGILAKRLAERWLEYHAPVTWNYDTLTKLEKSIHEWMLTPAGTAGYEKAEVAAGGVDTDELSSKTMESRKVCGFVFYRRSRGCYRPSRRL